MTEVWTNERSMGAPADRLSLMLLLDMTEKWRMAFARSGRGWSSVSTVLERKHPVFIK
jgi:hypothetical protein